MLKAAFAALSITLILTMGASASAETPEEWVKLLTRVHGGFGLFLPVGIKIGEDAMRRLNAKPRELMVTFYQGEGTPPALAQPMASCSRSMPAPARYHGAAVTDAIIKSAASSKVVSVSP